MTGDVRFGIIGLGGIARRFAKVLNTGETQGAVLRAVASERDPNGARLFGVEFNAQKVYKSYAELAADPDVDIVYIATTHNFHYANAKMMLEAGKGVLCEKPAFLTEREAVEVTELAASKGLFFMEAMWTRCLPSYQKAKEWAKSGVIGDVRLIDASFCYNSTPDPNSRLYNPFTAGGAMYDGGVYPIEYVTGIVCESPSKINAVAARNGQTGVDELTLVNFEFPSGVLAQTRCALRCPTINDAYIYGTEGFVVTRYFLNAHECERRDENNRLIEKFTSEFDDGFCFEINHAAGLFREGKTESPLIPVSDTVMCARIFDEVNRQI